MGRVRIALRGARMRLCCRVLLPVCVKRGISGGEGGGREEGKGERIGK